MKGSQSTKPCWCSSHIFGFWEMSAIFFFRMFLTYSSKGIKYIPGVPWIAAWLVWVPCLPLLINSFAALRHRYLMSRKETLERLQRKRERHPQPHHTPLTPPHPTISPHLTPPHPIPSHPTHALTFFVASKTAKSNSGLDFSRNTYEPEDRKVSLSDLQKL